MRLLFVELSRFWSRRITWVTMVVVGLLMAAGIGIAFTQSSAEEPNDQLASIDQGCLEAFISFRDVEGDPELQGLSDEELGRQFCADGGNNDRRFFATLILDETNTEDWSAYREIEVPTDPIPVDGEEFRSPRGGLIGIIPGVGTFLLVVTVLLGGSFVGAEYRSGTMENLLLWEPRRILVMVTKYLAGLISSAGILALLTSWLTLLLVGLAQFRGTFQGVDSTFWIDWAATVGRISLVGGLFFVLAMAIATLAKNTAAAITALLGWFVVSNILIELLARWFRHLELFTNANAFIGLGEVAKWVGSDNSQDLVFSHGPWVALGVVGVWAAIPAVLAIAVFRRRDIS